MVSSVVWLGRRTCTHILTHPHFDARCPHCLIHHRCSHYTIPQARHVYKKGVKSLNPTAAAILS